ncbi:MAG: hypothetical protein SOZ96_03325 [Treponema sp.]|nr:hypothetical protein [Treponema sp.]
MTENQIAEIAEKADMIVNNYAFTKQDEQIRILNLKNPDHAMVISEDGKLLETNMDEIEQVIVQNIWQKDSEFMEKVDA